MKIAINGWFLSNPYVGSGQYVRELLTALDRVDSKNEYHIFHSDGEAPLRLSSRFVFRKLGVRFSRPWGKVFWEQSLYKICRREGISFFHSPYLAASPFWKGIQMVNVHDVIYREIPAYRKNPGWRFYFAYQEAGVRRASRILTLSEHSKRDILRHLRVPETRVDVVYPGVSERFLVRASQEALDRLRDRCHIPYPYILYLGGYDIRKNVDCLLKAYESLVREGCHEEHGLVLAGLGPASALMRRLALERDWGRWVYWLPPVASEDLPALYQGASLFVYPSLYEGFGLPPAEAMASGTPVLASNRASLPEVIGRQELLFDPVSPGGLAEKMAWLLKDSAKRQEISKWGKQRAAQFKWEDTARKTLECYYKAGYRV